MPETMVVSYADSVAMRCVLEVLRDNPGSIAPPVAAGAAAWALGRIRHLEDMLAPAAARPGYEKARKMVLAIELDEAELACRILEAQCEMRRPPGMSATEALNTQSDQLRADVRRAAVAAMRYLEEQVNAGAAVS